MTKEEVRLECLKLAQAHCREYPAVLNLAKDYENWIWGETPKKQDSSDKPPSPKRSKAGSPDPFD